MRKFVPVKRIHRWGLLQSQILSFPGVVIRGGILQILMGFYAPKRITTLRTCWVIETSEVVFQLLPKNASTSLKSLFRVLSSEFGIKVTPLQEVPIRRLRTVARFSWVAVKRPPQERLLSAFANKLHNRAFRLFPGYSPTLTTGHFVQLVGFLERGRLRSDPHFNSQTELTLIDPAKYVWLTAGEQREATEVVLEFLGLGELIGKVSIPHLKSTDPAFLKIIKLELTPQIVRRIQDLYRNDFELLFPDLLPLNRDSG